jgi:hypothetical protein
VLLTVRIELLTNMHDRKYVLLSMNLFHLNNMEFAYCKAVGDFNGIFVIKALQCQYLLVYVLITKMRYPLLFQ